MFNIILENMQKLLNVFSIKLIVILRKKFIIKLEVTFFYIFNANLPGFTLVPGSSNFLKSLFFKNDVAPPI